MIEFNIKSEMRKGSGGCLRIDEVCVGINSLFPAHIFKRNFCVLHMFSFFFCSTCVFNSYALQM